MRNEMLRKQTLRLKRQFRVRKRLSGTAEKPRMCVVKTNKYIQVQIIDDSVGLTLCAASTNSKEFKAAGGSCKNKDSARKLGSTIAGLAGQKNIRQVVFDRGPFKYHGILAELADAARAGGMQF